MAPLRDPLILAQYRIALANWHLTGYVEWKEVARDWARANLGKIKPREIGKMMHEHVEAGGGIDQVLENRPEWNEFDYHYDLRLPIAGRFVYVETVLLNDDPDDPIIRVVSIHDA